MGSSELHKKNYTSTPDEKIRQMGPLKRHKTHYSLHVTHLTQNLHKYCILFISLFCIYSWLLSWCILHVIRGFHELNWKKKSNTLIKTSFVFHRERKMRLLASWTQSRTDSKWPKPRKIAWSKKRNMWARNSIDFLRNSIGK